MFEPRVGSAAVMKCQPDNAVCRPAPGFLNGAAPTRLFRSWLGVIHLQPAGTDTDRNRRAVGCLVRREGREDQFCERIGCDGLRRYGVALAGWVDEVALFADDFDRYVGGIEDAEDEPVFHDAEAVSEGLDGDQGVGIARDRAGKSSGFNDVERWRPTTTHDAQ